MSSACKHTLCYFSATPISQTLLIVCSFLANSIAMFAIVNAHAHTSHVYFLFKAQTFIRHSFLTE